MRFNIELLTQTQVHTVALSVWKLKQIRWNRAAIVSCESSADLMTRRTILWRVELRRVAEENLHPLRVGSQNATHIRLRMLCLAQPPERVYRVLRAYLPLV